VIIDCHDALAPERSAPQHAEPGDLHPGLEIVLPPADNEEAEQCYADMTLEMAFDPFSNRAVWPPIPSAPGSDDRPVAKGNAVRLVP
jgi:hypothetical protein